MWAMVQRWATSGHHWYRYAQQTSPEWLRLLLAGGLGAFFAVLIGAVNTHGEGVKVYIAVAAVVVAAAASFMSARAINEYADKRQIRRKANVASLEIDFVASEVRFMCKKLDDYIAGGATSENFDDVTLRGVSIVLDRTVRAAQELPKFDELLDGEDDVKYARWAKDAFQWLAHLTPVEPITVEVVQERRAIAGVLLADDGREHLAIQLERLNAAVKHFADRARG